MIGINGMAHVILTVSRFDLARAFYGKLLRRYARLLRSLRLARPRSNDVRLIFHGTPLVRKSSACEMSQSTVTRGNWDARVMVLGGEITLTRAGKAETFSVGDSCTVAAGEMHAEQVGPHG